MKNNNRIPKGVNHKYESFDTVTIDLWEKIENIECDTGHKVKIVNDITKRLVMWTTIDENRKFVNIKADVMHLN